MIQAPMLAQKYDNNMTLSFCTSLRSPNKVQCLQGVQESI